jgi:hypothetical protein
MPSAGFEPATPATKRPQTYALDRAATEVCKYLLAYRKKTPSVNSMKNWCEKFLKTGSVQHHLMLTDDLNVYYPKHRLTGFM